MCFNSPLEDREEFLTISAPGLNGLIVRPEPWALDGPRCATGSPYNPRNKLYSRRDKLGPTDIDVVRLFP